MDKVNINIKYVNWYLPLHMQDAVTGYIYIQTWTERK